MYHVSAQGVDERMINIHYYYYNYRRPHLPAPLMAYVLVVNMMVNLDVVGRTPFNDNRGSLPKSLELPNRA